MPSRQGRHHSGWGKDINVIYTHSYSACIIGQTNVIVLMMIANGDQFLINLLTTQNLLKCSLGEHILNTFDLSY